MRILEITFNSPDKRSGGGLGIYQSIISIANNFEIDYIGPYFDTSLFSNTKHKVNILSFLSPKKINPIKKILRLIFKKVSTSFYDSWIESNNKIEWEKYDFVHIEFSRYNFLVETCHQNQKKCIVEYITLKQIMHIIYFKEIRIYLHG